MTPLSFAQQRLWFHHELAGANSTYTVTVALRLRGELDRDALRLSFADVVKRHEVLRTVFPVSAGVPHQQVLDHVEIILHTAEVTGSELESELAARAGHVFDLSGEIPLRVSLLVVTPRDHVLLVVVHHIACDG